MYLEPSIVVGRYCGGHGPVFVVIAAAVVVKVVLVVVMVKVCLVVVVCSCNEAKKPVTVTQMCDKTVQMYRDTGKKKLKMEERYENTDKYKR
jgi:hypothetical protein